ncbi:membrane protein insertase YidC [Idiomarina seosinensis]|uniref:membrane protein insertase YidC n=1 Tax=Idiomarina seosinensis TaxID=281739 RepID=UPI003850CBCF
MNSPRSILFIAFLVVSFFLFQTWMVDTAPGTQAPSNNNTTSVTSEADTNVVPEAQGNAAGDSTVPDSDQPAAARKTGQLVEVKTDVLDIVIDAKGGDIVSAKLLQFAESLNAEDRFKLLERSPGKLYIAQSGLIGPDGIDSAGGRAQFSVEETEYSLEGKRLEVPLTYVTEDGSQITKVFGFERGKYHVDVRYEIENQGQQAKQVQFYGQLQQTMTAGEGGSMIMPTYFGAAYSHDDDKFEKYDFDDMQDQRLNVATQTGWVSMLEHYFVSAWIPTQQQDNRLFSRVAGNSQAIIGVIYPMQQVNAGSSHSIESTVYLGPKDQDSMAALAENLDLTVDYGFLWWLAQPIFKLLQFLQSIVLNWGLAIILTTVVVKAVLFPLTKAQYVSMAKMRMLQPKMTALRERYGSDRQKMSQAMMKLYKEEKVNPLGGCLPMLLQLPIFLALYWVLLESVELRHSEFIFWIQDLSTKDPYYILPILMGASMFLMQKLQPTPTADPMQQKLFQYMPVIFTVFFLWFPSGLVLYWLVSNLITIAQMLIIYKGLEKKGINVRGK